MQHFYWAFYSLFLKSPVKKSLDLCKLVEYQLPFLVSVGKRSVLKCCNEETFTIH